MDEQCIWDERAPSPDQSQPVETSPNQRYIRVIPTQYSEELAKSPWKVVYRALDRESGCQVSWHEVSLTHIPSEDIPRLQEDLDEIRTLKHENLINWVDQWVSLRGNAMVFITELIPEGSLREYLQKIKAPRLKVLRQWTRQILNALHYLHSRRPFPYVYGHLQPENLFYIPSSGTLKIGGLGKSIVFHNYHGIVCNRRFEYISPEALQGEPSPSLDIYSLGMCILEICTHSAPYEECKTPLAVKRRAIAGHKPLVLERILDEDVKEFIEMCLAPAEHRPTAEALLQHAFFNDTEESRSRPVQLKAKCEGTSHPVSESSTIELEMIIPPANGRAQRRIEFPFDLDSDTPDAVAEEMVEELHLPHELTPTLSKQISTHLAPLMFESQSPTHDSHSEEEQGRGRIDAKEMMQLLAGLEQVHSPTSESRSSYANAFTSASKGSLMSSRSLSPIEAKTEPPQKKLAKKAPPKVSTQKEEPETSPLVPQSPHTAITVIKTGQDNSEEDVRMLQTALLSIYPGSLHLNGIYGKKTEALVKRFQEERELDVTGVVTADLWMRICREHRMKKARADM